MWRYVYADELCHHGTKGMRWGIRRYQNKDGSLTPAGKRRRSLGQVVKDHRTAKKRKAALEKARETKAKNLKEEAKRKEALAKGKLSVKKMTDEELASAIKRLENEQKYNQKVLETSPAKRFMSKAWNDAVVPGVTEGGKALVKDFLIKKGSQALGLNEKKAKSAYDQLKEANDMSNWKKNMQVNEDYFAKREERIQKEAEDRAKAEAKKKVDAYNDAQEKDRWQDEGRHNMKGDGTSKSVPNDIPGTDSKSNKSGSNSASNTKSETKTESRSESKPRASSSSEAIKQITGPLADTPIDDIRNRKASEEGRAWVEDRSTGERIVPTTYREEKK